MRRWALALAVLVLAWMAIVLAVGGSPARAAAAAFEGSLGSPAALAETAVKTVPLLWCGLAVGLAFRAGVWNIGAEGQLVVGALAAAWATLVLPPGVWSAPLALVTGGLAGALWAAIAALLKSVSGVNEVLSTILLNFVAQALLGWAVHGPLMAPGGVYPQSAPLPATARLWRPLPPSRLHLGVVLVVAAALALAWLVRRTAWGLELRASGDGPQAARAAGVEVGRVRFTALVLSGLLAGLGGAVELGGVTLRLFERFSPGYGYSGIAVALLGGLDPLASVASAGLFGAMAAAAGGMERAAGVPPVALLLIEGLVVVALAGAWRRRG